MSKETRPRLVVTCCPGPFNVLLAQVLGIDEMHIVGGATPLLDQIELKEEYRSGPLSRHNSPK